MKITFVYPDFESIGVEYLMAMALKAGHQVEFVFYQAEDHYVNLKKGQDRIPATVEQIIAKLPDLVCFSCVTDNYRYQLECARVLKTRRPQVKTIFGGIHVTSCPEMVLKEDCVDAVAVGEADVAFENFLNLCRQEEPMAFPGESVPGIVFKSPGGLIGEFKEGPLADIDLLPRPHKEFYFAVIPETRVYYTIMTSRGCPYGCAYCFNAIVHAMRGRKIIRQRSIKNVLDELAEAKSKYAIKYVNFGDDSFTTNKQWLCDFLKQYKERIALPFTCLANPHYIDQDIAVALRQAGCLMLQLGVQSLSPKISRDVLLRITEPERVALALDALRRAGIMVQADHMLGIPQDTIANQEESILFYNQHRPHIISVFWLTYYPRTPIIKTALAAGALSADDLQQLESGMVPIQHSLHSGGSCKNPKPFYAIHFLLNYLPLLPRFLVTFLVKTKWYRCLAINNYYLSTVLPRLVFSFDHRYIWGRSLIKSFFRKKFERSHRSKPIIISAWPAAKSDILLGKKTGVTKSTI